MCDAFYHCVIHGMFIWGISVDFSNWILLDLSQAVDVYSEWLDECEKLNQGARNAPASSEKSAPTGLLSQSRARASSPTDELDNELGELDDDEDD